MEDSEAEKLINIGQFKEKWLSLLTMEDVCGVEGVDSQSYISLNASIPPPILAELETVCSPDTLTCPDVPKDADELLNKIPGKPDLSSVKHQQEELEHRAKSKPYRRISIERRKYLPRKSPWVHQEMSKRERSVSMIDGPEVLLTVEIYRPFPKLRRMQIDQEFHVLSSQYLSELRDKIHCNTDHSIPGDHSDRPNLRTSIKAKDLYKSGYFFIEDVFYNDMRDLINQENSKLTIEWARKEGIGEYRTLKMEETRFCDLTVVLGFPYLYEHQGQCQHILVFSDIRLVHKDDCQDRSLYPLATLERTTNKLMCRVCSMYGAKWVTRNCPIAPEDPCFYCNTCFQAFHYDISGAKLFEFKAYHMYDKDKK